MKARTLVLVGVITQAVFLVFFVFLAPEPHGFLKAAIAEVSANKASDPESKSSVTHALTAAMTAHAFLGQATIISLVVLILNRPTSPKEALVIAQHSVPTADGKSSNIERGNDT